VKDWMGLGQDLEQGKFIIIKDKKIVVQISPNN
jgi:hypothetical protein